MEPRPPFAAELWDRLSTPTREALRSLVQHYEQRLREIENRTRALEERLGIVAMNQPESPPSPEAERHSEPAEHEHTHRQRKRMKVVVDEVKHRRHRRKKLLRLLAKFLIWPSVVLFALLGAWYFFVKVMAFMEGARGAGE
jgi:hypothetical protein